MARLWAFAMWFGVGLGGCVTDIAPADELHQHTEAVIAIAETHWEDPQQAITLIEAYEDAHREEIEDLARRARKIRADLGQRAKRQLRARWNDHAADLRKRLQALAEGKQP